jgi:hypothetical protein
VTNKDWGDLSKAQQVKQLGRLLDIAFTTREAVGLDGVASGLAEVGRDAWVALEVERKHAHPTENVLQYWPWLDRSRRRLVLVHAIVPDAPKREGPRTELTKWLGALMERVLPGRFAYCRVELGTRAEAVQLEAAIDAIAELRQPHAARGPATGL